VIAGNVCIGQGSLIGSGAVVLPKTIIGDNAVVGAGAVVTKDVPDSCLVLGNPAVILCLSGLVVRSHPLRAYHRMTPLEGLGRYLRVADARLVAHGPVHPVVDAGVLVGVVRDATLQAAGDDAEVGDVMEQVPYASAFDALEELRGVEEFYDGAPVPIIDRTSRLIGGVRAEELDLMPQSPSRRGNGTTDG
jgi:hypothetical protein